MEAAAAWRKARLSTAEAARRGQWRAGGAGTAERPKPGRSEGEKQKGGVGPAWIEGYLEGNSNLED